ncbi:hypothetical protein HA520_16960 [Azotobacter chroococcum]|uniref:GIY-YIG domain-containing protein n=1 Tax=Azotobacter chroococcum TaxID=353 RepID=A0AA43ZB19_9GAMM|nr:hypothetical protein [Azotobacter chroococcum]
MDIESIQIIPIEASDPKSFISDLKKIFESKEAEDAKSVVYFFLSKRPIPRLKSESRILYIGKTINTLKQRWLPNVEKLNSKNNRAFYEHIIQSYGGLQIGYIRSTDPRADERAAFKKYMETHLEFPPKSKVG